MRRQARQLTQLVGSELGTDGSFAAVTEGSELHTTAEATSDPNGNEIDATTGWTPLGLTGTGANVFESQGAVKSAGSYALHTDSNDTPTNQAGVSKDIVTDFSLVVGSTILITFDWRHIGLGGAWGGRTANTSGMGTASTDISTITLSQVTFVPVSYYLSVKATDKYFGFREITTDDGGVYFDNLSAKVITLTNWTGWAPQAAIGALTGKAYKAPSVSDNLEQTTMVAEANKRYRIVWTLDKLAGDAGDGITVEFGSTDGTLRTASGTYIDYIIATDTDFLKFKQTDLDANLEVTINDVSIKQLSQYMERPRRH